MNDTLKGIIIGIIGSLLASAIIYMVTKAYTCNFSLSIWIWLCISVGIIAIIFVVKKVVLWCKIKNITSEFTEYSFGNSYVYTWKYKRSKNGKYSAYGYEATDIRTKDPIAEMKNSGIIICGHEVSEEKIKMIIQLLIIANIDKEMGKQLNNVIEYLCWTEDSRKHPIYTKSEPKREGDHL